MALFPGHTLFMLGLLTWALGLLASLWIQGLVNTLGTKLLLVGKGGWQFTFATYFPGEPVVDGVLLLVGVGYVLWRWSLLLRVLWRRFK